MRPGILAASMTPARLFLTGARDTLPLILAAIPFGIVYGALATSNGLSQWATLAISLFVYAGSAQFIAVTLVASAAALPVILLTVFVVNLRHMLYAASLMSWQPGGLSLATIGQVGQPLRRSPARQCTRSVRVSPR